MRSRALALILCLGGSLLGCSSKPSVSDIAAGVNEFWGTCAKISDVKKTNGVEDGNAYRVAFTYKLEILKDMDKSTCSLVQAVILGTLGSDPITKGDVFNLTGEKNMIKSEKGWIFQ